MIALLVIIAVLLTVIVALLYQITVVLMDGRAEARAFLKVMGVAGNVFGALFLIGGAAWLLLAYIVPA